VAGERIRGEGVHRRRAPGGARRWRVEVLLSQDERRELGQRAGAAKVSLARYLVDAALERPQTPSERRVRKAELHHTDRLIAGMAADIKQLANGADSTAGIPAATSEALAVLRRLTAAVEAIAEGAGYDLAREP